jgi:glycosyltransferase involved in cell wall biosynthesis
VRLVLVLESRFPSASGGGAEGQVATLGAALVRAGHRVTVVAPRLPGGPQQVLGRHQGMVVYRIAYPHVPILGATWMLLKLARLLIRRRKRIDAIHAHIAHHMAAVTCAVAAWIRKPVVVKFTGWWELERGVLRSRGAGVTGLVARRLLRRADAVQAISTRLAQEVRRRGFPALRVHSLPNAVDVSRFRANDRVGDAAHRTFVFVGRLVPEKALTELLNAWAQAFAGSGVARLRVIGSGPLREHLEAEATRLGISAEVVFTGHRDDVAALLADSDVGVLSSRIEGLSNTLLEYLACALPVVATRISGNEDFVRTGVNGWLYEPGDVPALAAALRAAARAPAEHLRDLGRRGRETVSDQAGVDVVTRRLLALYAGPGGPVPGAGAEA